MEKWWVETWKCRPKIQLNHGESASAGLGCPRRSHPGGIDTFPHQGLGYVWGQSVRCEVVSYCSCASSSSAYCVGSRVSDKNKLLPDYYDQLLLRVRRIFGGHLLIFSLSDWFLAEKVCLYAVPHFTRDEAKRKLKQPLNNLNFGLLGISRSWRLLLRHLNEPFHWLDWASQGPSLIAIFPV